MISATYTEQKIVIPTVNGTHFFKPEDITRLEGNSNYTRIHFINRKPLLMAKVLKKYEQVLAPLGFLRIHQSHLVNTRYVSFVDASGQLIMQDEQALSISRRKRKEVMQELYSKNAAPLSAA